MSMFTGNISILDVGTRFIDIFSSFVLTITS